MADPVLSIRNLGVTLTGRDGSVTEVTANVSLDLAPGEFVSIVGPSGSGKTTLLRAASGLRAPTSGQISFAGRQLSGVAPGISVVFQEYNKSLFPWLSIGRNVAMGARRLPPAQREEHVREALHKVGLDGFASRYPWELSGGMQQRAALARALVSDPQVLMMDEPFASVDALTRGHLEDVVADLWERSSFASLLVTHDVGEAVYLSDRVLVLSARPSRVLAEITVDLPRPRTQTQTRRLARFVELEAQVLERVEEAGRVAVGLDPAAPMREGSLR
ncbi:MAG TPA: ABC transporter ATP-binding protein [Acidimicrobiales bacterium]|nr:ABC transporter ATP-binding protein [Acidimicrobiales bacterium]